MEITVNKLSNSSAELKVSVTAEKLKEYDEATYKKLVEDIEIKGFRKGTAPKMLLLQHIGHEKYNAELLNTAIPMSFYDAIVEHELTTVAPPEVSMTKFVPGEVLEYTAKVALMPEVTLPDYASISVERKTTSVTDAEVEEVLDALRRRTASLITRKSDEPAVMSDRVEIDFDATSEGKPLPRGSSKNHPLVIGDKLFVPGFEEALVGMKQTEEKSFDLKFPDDYHEKELAGKPVSFKAKMNLIQKVDLPELNDEFATRQGPYKNLAELKDNIKKSLSSEKTEALARRIENEVLGKMSDAVKVELPEVMIAQETEHLMQDLEANLGESGLKLDQYLKTLNKTYEQFREELKAEAARRIKVSLVLTAVVRRENLSVTDDEVKDVKEEDIQSAKNALVASKAVKFLVDHASYK